ncbi:unnamed protein product [Calypogeia fissa]
MAKQRRQKQKDASRAPTPSADGNRPFDSCCATVRSQKLCIAVDIAQQRIYGYTELTVVAPKNGVIGLHAHDLHIEQVLVDGVPASFELLQQQQQLQNGGGHSFTSSTDAADASYLRYIAALDQEMSPELLIRPGEAATPVDASQDPPSFFQAVVEAAKDNGGVQPSTPVETKPVAASEATLTVEQCNVVRVNYWVEKPVAGAHFRDKVFHTNNQLRRSRCWFPCVDSTSERCSFSLEIAVPSEYIAVSNGKLLYQVYSAAGPHLKTYAYSMSIPITANYISLVVAPVVILPDRSNVTISHMCMPGDASRLQCTVNFFHLLFSAYEEYLGAPFPFGCYKQVFIESESTISSVSVGASMVTLSSHLLVDERIIDQAFVTQVKLAHALAQQWFGVYITPDTPADAWLLEGLAGFLCDHFVKRYMGNNEARYRRFKANEAVCMVDVEGAPVLSSPSVGGADLYGTESIGALGQIRAWKATAVVQMLEKQMGPEPFKKILQRIILRAQDPVRQMRTLSTKEFRHFANKLGNLERPYLKEFFPRWVETSGCPRLRMGFLYSKRRNMVELAVHRESTAASERTATDKLSESKSVTADFGWPGMMSIRIHELDGMYDHPSLPMAGEAYQLLDIQCHSKLAGRRVPKPKRGTKPDATDDNMDAGATDVRLSLESPLLWLRADPQMEYIAEIHLNQPEQMWINQLEKDRDVVGQLHAIAAMVALPRPSFAIAAALNNALVDSKVFCRVRIEAASALASTATEANSWVGLSHLIKFYKSCRCDPEIGLPKSNDFHDLAEYLVLQAIPGTIAAVRGSDGKSPIEATDFVLHVLKHNDNSGNQYSDVFWLASLIESIGGFEFGPQNMKTLSKFLKQIDRFLQYDRLMPSYNDVLTVSCIQTLTCLAVKFPNVLPLERLKQLLRPFGDVQNTTQLVRVTALQSLLEVEARSEGLDSAAQLALRLVEIDPSLKVQSKIMQHMIDLFGLKGQLNITLSGKTYEALVRKLDSVGSFSNVLLRHHLFSLVQILAGRSASLYRKENSVAPQIPTQQMSSQTKAPPKEVKVQSTLPLKVKVQQPHAEPIRIRVVKPTVTPKVEQSVASASSGGKEPSKGGPRIGKVKLRLKPASLDGASPMELSAGSLDKGAVAASQSPVSVQASVKAEPMAEESSQSRQGRQKEIRGAQRVKEEVVTPAAVEEGEIESADNNAAKVEGSAIPEPGELSQLIQEIGEGMGIGSSKGSPVDGLFDTSDKDGKESLSGMSHGPNFVKHENGEGGPYDVLTQLHSTPQEINLKEVHKDLAAGSSAVSDTKPVAASSAIAPAQGKELEKKKEKKEKRDKKDKKDRKHKKDKKKHNRDVDDDSQSQDKRRANESDIEYQEQKRKRKAEKDQKKREKEGRKSQKLDVNVDKSVKVEETATVVPVVSKSDGDLGQKIRLKIKTIHTVPARP